MRVLLLGATGLLGHNVLLSLLEGGHEVVVLVRRRDRLQLPQASLEKNRLRVLEGSYDTDQLRQAAHSCQAIINCAGITDMSLLRYDDYVPINVTLCEQLLQVMSELEIHTLVHVSTANTIGFGTPQLPGNEEDGMEPPFTRSFYARSKRAAEQMLDWAAMEHPDWHIVCLNPGFMVGPYDTKPSSGRLLLAARGRKVMAVPSGGKAFVDVRDVAAVAVRALEQGENGHHYLLTSQSLTLQQFYCLQAAVCGYKQRIFVIPRWLVCFAGKVGDLLRFCGIRSQLSTRNVRQLLVKEYYDSTAAQKALGFTPSELSDAIRDFFQWHDQHTATKT